MHLHVHSQRYVQYNAHGTAYRTAPGTPIQPRCLLSLAPSTYDDFCFLSLSVSQYEIAISLSPFCHVVIPLVSVSDSPYRSSYCWRGTAAQVPGN